jgi:GNAT superfamily N-acetyltransferase
MMEIAMHVIRTLLPTEFGLLKEHLLRLEPDDRLRRFQGHASDQRIADYVGGLDRFHVVVVAWIEHGQLRGAAELSRFGAPVPTRGEIAVTVDKAWQDRGVGTELLRRALTIARNRGIEQIYMVCLAENGRMRHIADKFAGKLVDLGGEIEAMLALKAPDGFSLWQEAMDLGHATVASAFAQLAPGRSNPS